MADSFNRQNLGLPFWVTGELWLARPHLKSAAAIWGGLPSSTPWFEATMRSLDYNLLYSSKHLLRFYLELFFGVPNTFSDGIWGTRVTKKIEQLLIFLSQPSSFPQDVLPKKWTASIAACTLDHGSAAMAKKVQSLVKWGFPEMGVPPIMDGL